MADFSITQIPAIMDANGWRVAATLLRRWFAGPANRTPESGIACWDVVKMDWVLGFERAKAAYRSIFEQGLWKTPNAQKEMRAVLKRLGKMIPNSCSNYGRDAVSLPRTHRDHLQFVSVGGGTWDMATSAIDHLTAALARFNFHVIALGPSTQQTNRIGSHSPLASWVCTYAIRMISATRLAKTKTSAAGIRATILWGALS